MAPQSEGEVPAPVRPEPRRFFNGNVLKPDLARGLAAQLSISCGFSLYFLMPKYLSIRFGASPFAIGSLSATALAAAVLTTPLTGAALDRWGRKRPMMLGAVLVVLSSLGMLSVTGVGVPIYGWRVLQGVGFALGYNGAAACVADVAAPNELGHAMSLLGAASLLTNAAAPALGESIASRFGWSPVFGLAAATGLLTLAIVSKMPAAPFRRRLEPAAESPISFLAYITLVNGAVFAALITFVLPFALLRGAERVAGYLVGYTLGALAVRLFLGSVADKWGRRRVAQLSLLGYGLVAMGTAFLMVRWLPFFGACFGIMHGFLYPALAAMTVEGCSPDRRGRRLSNFGAAFNLGAGLSLLISGWLARISSYPAAFLTIGAFTVLSALAFLRSGPSPTS